MALGCCGKTFSCLFIFFNVVFSIIGVVTLGIGIFIKVNPSPQFLSHIEEDGYEQYLANSVWIIIVFGALVLLVSFCGCVGAYNKSECLLGMYIAFSLVILLGALAVWISTIVFIVKLPLIRDRTAIVTQILVTKYKEEATKFTKPWNFLQSQLHCCGASNFTDYHVVFTGKDQGKVPKSCCVSSDNHPEASSIVSCQEYTDGCMLRVTEAVHSFTKVLLVANIIICVLAIIGIIIAAWLCRRGDEKQDYSTL